MDIKQYEEMQKAQAAKQRGMQGYINKITLDNGATEMPRFAGDACDAKRQTSADEMLRYSEDLACMAEMLVNRIGDKLGPYMQFCPEEPCNEGTARTFPPYFERLRDNLTRIANAIDAAGDLVHNTDL